jgi:hypothetical protein
LETLPDRQRAWIQIRWFEITGLRETGKLGGSKFAAKKAPLRRLPRRGIRISGQLLKQLQRYSDFHHTRKLVPSKVSEVGTASFTPEQLTMVISCTLLPKALIRPEVTLSIAVLVPESLV